jgi:hypothetical protein
MARKVDTAGPMSTSSGAELAASTWLFHSVMNLPLCDSLTNEPILSEEMYCSRNLGRASVGGSFALAWAKISMGTGESGPATCASILAASLLSV